MNLARRLGCWLAAGATLLGVSSPARAGGMEMPDNGTEALGRGGAFTAKADSPTAIHHNVGGLAQQRGTRLLLNANLARSSLAFQRDGVYPGDPNNAATPWAGKRYPLAENEGGLAVLPFVGLTSDFGLQNMTFALGLFAPPVMSARVYPLVRDGSPSPVRYDSVGGGGSIIVFHTAAAALKVTDWLDIGVALHVVQADLGMRLVDYQAIGPLCLDPAGEHPACDVRGEASVSTWTGTGSLGALIRPGGGWAVGLHARGPTYLNMEGTAKLQKPVALTALDDFPETRVYVKTQLPWILRAGVRKAFGPRAADPSNDPKARFYPGESADVELDMTYETWGTAMNPGPKAFIENVAGSPRESNVTANYHDTFSVRFGGSYSVVAAGVPVTLRGGAFFDRSATESAYTRLDNDTLDKFAGTLGVGVRFGSMRFDLAYASVHSVTRTVTDGAIRTTDEKPNAPVVNNGVYGGHTHIASLGATFELDMILGTPRFPLAPVRGRRSSPASL